VPEISFVTAKPDPQVRDFFVSYNGADRRWAIWIGKELTKLGYTFYTQYQDMPAGSNFVLGMHEALKYSRRTLALLSPQFLASEFCAPEWAGAFVHDPTGKGRKLIPIRVRDCAPDGLLAAIVYGDLVDKPEAAAREELHTALSGELPSVDTFPGDPDPLPGASFPGGKSLGHPASVKRLPVTDSTLIGRASELLHLDQAWAKANFVRGSIGFDPAEFFDEASGEGRHIELVYFGLAGRLGIGGAREKPAGGSYNLKGPQGTRSEYV